MEIVPIFDKCLYSVCVEGGDELAAFLEQIQDVEWLMEFFSNNISDLESGFYGSITVSQAIERTLDEARQLNKKLLEINSLHNNGKNTGLDSFFKPLINTETKAVELQKSKANGPRHKSWIRIYAIKVEKHVYVVTGGTIKLTENMNHSKHTLLELSKLTKCRDFLKSNDIIDSDSFFEFLTD